MASFDQRDIEDDGGDFYAAFKALTTGGGTRVDKRLPAPAEAPGIPERTGSGEHQTAAASSGGGGVDMALKGAKTVTSTDGMVTLVFPETAEALIQGYVLTFPAIKKTP